MTSPVPGPASPDPASPHPSPPHLGGTVPIPGTETGTPQQPLPQPPAPATAPGADPGRPNGEPVATDLLSRHDQGHGTGAGVDGGQRAATASSGVLLLLFAAGAAVALTLGVIGRVHEPTGVAVNLAGFSGPLAAKAWLTTGAAALGVLQLVSALAMYGRLPLAPGAAAWGPVHRWSGRGAFLLTIPVAVHCLYALGFQFGDTRVLVHSLLGCAFYGALTVKLLGLSRSDLPGWFLPVLGGTVLTLLVGLWLTSSLWFFTTFGVQF